MSSFGFYANQDAFNAIVKRYTEKRRVYHNEEHLADCLEKLDSIPLEPALLNEIELALWFHDAIYNPYAKDNELKSARLASGFLKEVGANRQLQTTINNLILATQHSKRGTSEAEKIIMDIDLSVLGASAEIYQKYASNIRKEYKMIPGPLYRKKRKELLQRFLARNPLFQTALFQDKFEHQARQNLRWEIERYS